MNYCGTKTKEHLEYNQLLEEFVLGCKTDKKIGLEYERIPLIKVTNQVAKYDGEYGIWQYSSSVILPDVYTSRLDQDIAYKDYAKIIRNAGLNRLVPDVIVLSDFE